jgi:cytochrome oxidase assembly protein ShyY1
MESAEITHIAIFLIGLILGTIIGIVSSSIGRWQMNRRREKKLYEHIKLETKKKHDRIKKRIDRVLNDRS